MAVLLLFVLFSFRNHGLIQVVLYNDLDFEVKLLCIQNKHVQEYVKPQQSTMVSYRVSHGETSLSISLLVEGRTVNKEIIEYLEPAYHGKVTVRVYRSKTGDIDYEIVSRLSLQNQFCPADLRPQKRI